MIRLDDHKVIDLLEHGLFDLPVFDPFSFDDAYIQRMVEQVFGDLRCCIGSQRCKDLRVALLE